MAKFSKNKQNNVLTVGELSKRSGVPVSAIHFYEEKGLIKSWRTEGNQRRFPRGLLRIIAIIKASQTLGFSLEEIKTAMNLLPQDFGATPAQWNKVSVYWKAEIDKKIKKITSLRDQLDSCIGCGCLSLQDCPLRNPNDREGKKKSGAAFL